MSRILTSCASGVSPVLSMVMARRRFVVFLAAFWILMMLMFSGAGNVDMTRLSVSGANRPGAPGTKAAPDAVGGGSNSSSLHVPANLTARPHIEYHGYKRPGYELPLANGIPMRIVALGASTTRGDSPEPGIDNNGFRRPIREKLMAIGNKVNFVGTSRLGNMTDNDIVAGPGVQVDRIHNMAKEAIPQYKPNVILVNAGANDCFMHVDIDNFYKRYDSLIQYLLAASHRTTIVLGTLLPTTDKRFNGREDVFRVNPQIRRMAKIYQRQGLPVVLAELQGPDGVQDQNLASDGMHPGTAGYEMMATKMFEAIVEADARGFLQEPEPIHELPDDGEDDRKDEAYHKWAREKKKMDEEHERKEAEEMDRMEAELKKARAAL